MQKLIFTTHNDLSLPYFDGWQVVYYDEDVAISINADLIYLRDPFNDPTYQPTPEHLDQIISRLQNAKNPVKIIDKIHSFADIVKHEDKYQQSVLYGDLYPHTWLPCQGDFIPGKTLAKPRISQRAKDILFDLGGRELDDSWIIQDLLDIEEELRIYVIFGEILPVASIKSSKSTGAVKVVGTRPLTDRETSFVRKIMQKCPLDVVGLDLAVLKTGDLKLIEVNRSPQFKRYSELTGLNLASKITENSQNPAKTNQKSTELNQNLA